MVPCQSVSVGRFVQRHDAGYIIGVGDAYRRLFRSGRALHGVLEVHCVTVRDTSVHWRFEIDTLPDRSISTYEDYDVLHTIRPLQHACGGWALGTGCIWSLRRSVNPYFSLGVACYIGRLGMESPCMPVLCVDVKNIEHRVTK